MSRRSSPSLIPPGLSSGLGHGARALRRSPPPPDGKTPWGRDALEGLRDAGATILRTGPMGGGWDDDAIEQERRWLDAAAEHGLHGWVNLRELSCIRPGETEKEAKLRAIIERFKDHPGLGLWKNYDEAAWNRQPVEAMLRGYRIIPFPARCGRGPWLRMPVSVLYEAPRTITARGGSFTDWFGAFEVHVYRFRRS